MDTAIRVQILDEAACISYSANTIEKGMNPSILFRLLLNFGVDWDLLSARAARLGK